MASSTWLGTPASGVVSVGADVSTLTTGGTSVALTTAGGPWTAGGVSYAYRSALLTTKSLPDGNETYTVTATDAAGNTSAGFGVTVDSTKPVAANIQTANGGQSGTPDQGDTVIFTTSESLEALSISPGRGGASTNVVVRVTDGLLVTTH